MLWSGVKVVLLAREPLLLGVLALSMASGLRMGEEPWPQPPDPPFLGSGLQEGSGQHHGCSSRVGDLL